MLDNQAIAFIKAPKRLKVLLASPGNFWLEKALRSAPMTQVTRTGPRLSGAKGYDLVICDGFTPRQLPECPVLYFAPPRPPSGVLHGDSYQHVKLTHWNRSHLYMRYLDLSDVSIAQTRTYQLENARGLAFQEENAIIALLTERPYEDVVVGFKLEDSDWGLRASWPIFIFNILERIRELKHLAQARMVRPGETVPIEPGQAKQVRVIRPGGEQIELAGDGTTVYFHQTDRIGIYQTKAGSRDFTFAVNLLSREESDTAPRNSLDLGGRQIQRKSAVQQVKKPLWRWFALAALAICMLEWWVFHRKIA